MLPGGTCSTSTWETWGRGESNTMCPSCGALLVRRVGYSVKVEHLADGVCRKCGTKVPIVCRSDSLHVATVALTALDIQALFWFLDGHIPL